MQEVTEQVPVQEKPKAIPKEERDRFYCIKLAKARDANDIPVPSAQAGNKANKWPRVMLKRGSWVPVHAGVMEVLQNSTYKVWAPVEGEDRKVATERARFSLDGKIEISLEGYRIFRKKVLSGKEITEQEIMPYRI